MITRLGTCWYPKALETPIYLLDLCTATLNEFKKNPYSRKINLSIIVSLRYIFRCSKSMYFKVDLLKRSLIQILTNEYTQIYWSRSSNQPISSSEIFWFPSTRIYFLFWDSYNSMSVSLRRIYIQDWLTHPLILLWDVFLFIKVHHQVHWYLHSGIYLRDRSIDFTILLKLLH